MPELGPWGGGNSWLKNLISFFEFKKIRYNFKLTKKTSCIFIVNVKSFFFKKNFFYYLKKKKYNFNYEDLVKFKIKNPQIPIILRVNDTDIARGSNYIDLNTLSVSKISDITIFISNWVKNYYLKKKIKYNKSYVIENFANYKNFNSKKKKYWNKKQTFKIATHHWSSNYQKGFYKYRALDQILFEKKINNIKFFIIGNVPKNINWKVAKIIKPLPEKEVSKKLKNYHAYITGAKNEAGAFHVIEALQSGLPVIYFNKSGNIKELVGKDYGIQVKSNQILNTINILRNKYFFYIKNLLHLNSFAEKNYNNMLELYFNIIINCCDEKK
jgi:hypothetical protein